MTAAIFPKAKEAMLQGNLNLAGGAVKIALIDTDDYVYDPADEFLSDLPSGAVVDSSAALASKTFTNGTFASADASVIGVTGDQFEGLLFYIDTGNAATSRLIAFDDSTAIDGLPAIPAGGNYTIECPTDGWFDL